MNSIKGFFISTGLVAAAAIAVLSAPAVPAATAAPSPDGLAVTATPLVSSDAGAGQFTATSDDSGDDRPQNRRVEVRI